jgi:hypothetical protein
MLPRISPNRKVASLRPEWLRGWHAGIGGDHGLVTSSEHDLLQFITSSFRSVWALELLLVLKQEPRIWTRLELVTTMRASELVVSKALDSLLAAGLASLEGEGARYMPVSQEVALNVERSAKHYAARPDAVRRAIVSASAGGLTAFADAFRLRKD